MAEEAPCYVLAAQNRHSGVIEDRLQLADIEQFAAEEQMRQLRAEFRLDSENGAGGDDWRLRAALTYDAEVCAALASVAWQRAHATYEAILCADMHRRLFALRQEARARDVGGLVREHPERALVAEAERTVVRIATFRQDVERQFGVIGNDAAQHRMRLQEIIAVIKGVRPRWRYSCENVATDRRCGSSFQGFF